MITVQCIGTLPPGITKSSVRALVALACRRAGCLSGAVVSLRVTDDRAMRTLNRTHRGKDRTTDVLSFAYGEGLPPGVRSKGERELGDIIVSLPQVRRQAKAISRPIKAEFSLIVVHGTLHLLGFDHETLADERRMFRLQHDILIKAGIF